MSHQFEFLKKICKNLRPIRISLLPSDAPSVRSHLSKTPNFLMPFRFLTVTLLSAVSLNADTTPEEAARHFTLKALPILSEKCFSCHGEKKTKGELDMLTRESLLKGGEDYPDTLVPGDADASKMFEAIKWEDPDLEMPPKENDRLTPEQIETLRTWINNGAPWPTEAEQEAFREADKSATVTDDGIIVKTSGGLADSWTYRRYQPEDIWAFQPLKKDISPPSDTANPIDAFILEKLAAENLPPGPPADPATLIRRITFDLTGLPPTPAENEKWLARYSSENNLRATTATLVDQLLASPAYGERWAQHWLDTVRYADSAGFSNDYERSNAWRYRDYVIRSFNADKPYNQFAKEQLAGDEIDPENPENIIATGFLRMGPWEHTAMSPADETRQGYIDDTINIVGQTFLSTTMRCFKCHDHKFDPLSAKDYYRFYSAFATTQPVERPAAFLPSEDKSNFDYDRKEIEKRLTFSQSSLDSLYSRREEMARKWYQENGKDYVSYEDRANLPDGTKPPRHYGLTTAEEGEIKVREQDVKIWTRARERFEPLAQSVYSGGYITQPSDKLRMPDPNNKGQMKKAETLPENFILSGGAVASPTDPVTPGVISSIGLVSPTATRDDPWALPTGMTGRRSALAEWITNPDNQLTTRSIVNRVWGWHFGQAIAGNPNNFGKTGKKPTHPELLDWLAHDFVENGWSFKHLHRLILTVDAYMRSPNHPETKLISEKDPDNLLLATFTPRRLTAEELRDALLATTGELDPIRRRPPHPPGNELRGRPVRAHDPVLHRPGLPAIATPGTTQPPLHVCPPTPWPDRSLPRRIQQTRFRRFLRTPRLLQRHAPGLHPAQQRRHHQPLLGFRPPSGKGKRRPRRPNQAAFQTALLRDPNPEEQATLTEHYQKMLAYHQNVKPEPFIPPTDIRRSLVEEFSGEPFEYDEILDVYRKLHPRPTTPRAAPHTRALADICLILFNTNEFVFVY